MIFYIPKAPKPPKYRILTVGEITAHNAQMYHEGSYGKPCGLLTNDRYEFIPMPKKKK